MKISCKRTIITCTILLGATLGAQAATGPASGIESAGYDAAVGQVALHHGKKPRRQTAAAHASSGVVTYDHDSKDPNVGWHTEGGMRVCHNDCDNPEIPGSGYTCYNVTAFGMPMRECDWSSW